MCVCVNKIKTTFLLVPVCSPLHHLACVRGRGMESKCSGRSTCL